MTVRLAKADILRLFKLLDAELAIANVVGEVFLVGGAVMCLALDARDSTNDVDAAFRPARAVREAAARVAMKAHVAESWLNDGVKGFLSARGEFSPYLEHANLRVYVALPEYLLAMKAVAMRLGETFHDLGDVRFLLRYLNVASVNAAMDIIEKYFDARQIPPKTRYALEELLSVPE